MPKKMRKDKFGVPLKGSVQSVGEWKAIPETEKHKVSRKWHDGVQVFNSDLDAALRAAQEDKKQRFR